METIAVIFGGRSAEHDISIVTALASIIRPLELTKKYHIEPVYIAKNGAWYSDSKLKDIDYYTSGAINDLISHLTPISLQLDGGLKIVKASGLAGRKQYIPIDIVFPSMHGTYGEDGSLMGLLDLAGVPYVGCGVAASAVSMNKVLAKQLAEDNGIAIAKYVITTKHELETEPTKVIKTISSKLKYPLFVKPAHLGSSIGISRVKNDKELSNGLEVAAHYDSDILVEEEVPNLIEVTLPIMGNEEPIAANLEKPLTKPEDFFDFDTKYLNGGKKGKGTKGSHGYSQVPADIPKDLYEKALQTGLKVYKAFGLSGISRVDMLINAKTKTIYFNEINPLPGGLYAHNWNKAGISNVELVNKLIGYAKERFSKRQSIATSFSTNYLKQF
ncbi:MAG: D-alanine--D-alanine ligase family protein [Candidatus Saccharimonadales bacterium]